MNTAHDSFLNDLPQGWKFDRFKDIVSLRNEKTDEASAEEDYLELEDMDSGSGRILSRRNTLEVGSAVTRFKTGDVLFGKLRPYLEKYWVAEFDGKCTGEILAFEPQRIASRFLFYCLGSRWFIERCNALAYGAKMPRVSWPTQLAQFNFPLPPLSEQQRIAAYLDASCAAIDAAVTAKRRQIETLGAVRESIIETAVTRGLDSNSKFRVINHDWLGSLPEHWAAVRIKRVISHLDYGISVSSQPEGKYPVLKMGNIQSGEIVFSKMEFVDEVAEELLLEKNDLLYNRTNSPDQVGKAALFLGCKGDEVTFASYLVRLRVNHRIIPEFLNYAVNCAGFLAFARRLAIPSVQQSNLNSTRYARMFIPLPPISEQRSICQHLREKVGEMKCVVNTIESQIATLTAYRKSLIHECVTGQRRITEADINRVKAHG
ncbi:restriction endonuclease subunit S [uncultured Thiocystis sp.]|jgi:type I restriction enzyme S subunit|uniref:restriction endonuclease subunit S n=1 Tax=uncultured Thiocystis sp. TaxID=1202134 RepID=UPI0025EE4EC5|nr:restriction endonuclease subunit S [uncultured Thiocystis sp.]